MTMNDQALTGTTDSAFPMHAQLVAMMETFMASQRTVLRLVQYVDARQSEIDSRRDVAIEFARREYTDVPAETVEGVVEVLETFTSLASTISDQPTDAQKEELQSIIDVGMKAIPEDYRTPHFFASVARARIQDPSAPLLLSSLLTTLVGDFELLIASLAKSVINRHPKSLDASERTFTWKDISAHSTLEDLKERVIERAVDDLLRESSEGWMKFFETKYKIKVPGVARTAEVLEVFQRRHVVVHNGGTVSRQYLEHVSGLTDPPQLGERLTIDSNYLKGAADLLCTVAVCLVHNVALKMLSPSELAIFEPDFVNVPYRLLQDQRYQVIKVLVEEQTVGSFVSDYNRLVVQVNGWLAKKRLGELEDCRAEIEAWQVSALTPIFHLAKCALLDSFERGHELVLQLRGGDSLPLHFWLTWPLLAELREYERQMVSE